MMQSSVTHATLFRVFIFKGHAVSDKIKNLYVILNKLRNN